MTGSRVAESMRWSNREPFSISYSCSWIIQTEDGHHGKSIFAKPSFLFVKIKDPYYKSDADTQGKLG